MKATVKIESGEANNRLSSEIVSEFRRAMFEQREDAEHFYAYENERNLLRFVARGDLAGLRAYTQEHRQPAQVGFALHDELRQARYMLVSAVTLLTRAAISGGVTQIEAYNLSDVYIQKGDSAKTPREVHLLTSLAATDFTQRVSRQKSKPIYSRPIAICREYISAHLHYAIGLAELCEACGLSPAYLSRLFKKETGKTTSAYILEEKLSTARFILASSQYPIHAVASLLAFASHSAFTKAFHSRYQLTPGAFRRMTAAASIEDDV